MKAYSKDLRQKIVEAIERGMPKAQAARTFGAGISTLKRYVSKAQRGESLEPGKAAGKAPNEQRGCQLVYLPSYSPDFNPTLRKRSARSRVWCAKRELARGRHWLRYWAKHFRRSASRTLEAISSMLAIVHKPNYCETCCIGSIRDARRDR